MGMAWVGKCFPEASWVHFPSPLDANLLKGKILLSVFIG